MNEYDFYSGFEPEPELVIEHILEGHIETILHVWIGFFDEIMIQMKPEDGEWTGLLRHYHLHTGWYEDNEWRDPSPQQTLIKFINVSDSYLGDDAKEIKYIIVKIIDSLIRDGGELVFKYY